MIIAGIDYSMSSPAICIHQGDEWSFSNCSFYYLTNKKKFATPKHPFYPTIHDNFDTQEERFDNISTWALKTLPDNVNTKVFLEGYAFGAKGVVFQIGENTGILKHKLWKTYENPLQVLQPSAIKKFATGKGNANKEVMYEAFIKETSCNLQGHFLCKIGESPMSDIVDSYYIAKFGFQLSKTIK